MPTEHEGIHVGCSDKPEDASPIQHGCMNQGPLPRDVRLPQFEIPLVLPVTSSSKICIAAWCKSLVTSVFRTRTKFAAFVKHAISLPRADVRSVSPAFPLPLPFCGIFGKMPPSASHDRRSKIDFRRAVTIVVLALNFWWSGEKFIEDAALRRVPSPSQRSIFHRIGCLLQVDGPFDDFLVVDAGRKFPQLVARLGLLSDALTALGPGSTAYDKTFEGCQDAVPADPEELMPYRSLNAERLVLHGRGHWDPTPHMSDTLAMAYRNPDVLLFDADLLGYDRPKMTDPVSEIALLAKLWDKQGLLYVHHHDIQGLYPHELTKVFNCLKSATTDRQIGDRRGRNGVESKIEGPSHNLPTGFDLLDLAIQLPHECLTTSVTDRRDFYHQFAVSQTRAISNSLGPPVDWKLLEETNAFNLFLLRNARSKRHRLTTGDGLGGLSGRFPQDRWDGSQKIYVAFQSILQGDHGGVEYACDAHCSFLQSEGLLSDRSRVIADRPFFGKGLLEGLVIDDYFTVAVSSRKGGTGDGLTADVRVFKRAKAAYARDSILGSDSKDVVGQRVAKVVGAQINSSETALSKGLCTLGSPPQKRYGLAWITLMLCQLPWTTDVLHVCLIGAWVSILMYRRPLMSVLNRSFKLVNAAQVDALHPKLIRLSRAVACELTLLATLVPLAVSDLAAEFSDVIYATDSSMQKGAICSKVVPLELAKLVWSGLRSKGAYHRLLTPAETLSKRLGLGEELPDDTGVHCSRPLAFHYDFIEVFSGAAVITVAMSELGFVTGPPVDLSCSPEFNMEWVHVISWLTFLVSTLRVKAFFVSPPCTTFSIMRRPALRSRLVPYGFQTCDRQTSIGNLLAHRAFQLLTTGWQNRVPGILETPWSALLKHLPGYQHFLNKPSVEMCRTDSCMFGSIHQKSFRLLAVHAALADLAVKCSKDHEHVRIEGSYTKASATYVPRLANAIARCLATAIAALKLRASEADSIKVKGHENQLVNALALSGEWRTDASWKFSSQAHINILEMSSLCKLATKLAKKGKSLRVTSLMDSFVCSSAVQKGRSSSIGLSGPLRRLDATAVAASLYFCTPFVPTRLNIADDPTRDAPLRDPSGSLDLSSWGSDDLELLCKLPRLRRWASNWVRLCLSLCGPVLLSLSDRSLYRQAFSVEVSHVVPALRDPDCSLDFDSSLGFPGEGRVLLITKFGPPLWGSCSAGFLILAFFLSLLLIFGILGRAPRSCFLGRPFQFLAMALCVTGTEGAFAPRNAADRGRASIRAGREPLQAGRPIQPLTAQNREVLFAGFSDWCTTNGVDLVHMLINALQHLDELNAVLCRYGRELYSAGRPYGHFAETINAVGHRRPAVRRHLQQAWDLAYAWMRAEPPVHHTAMPFQILLGCVTAALLWGWTRVAGVLALTWGGVLRIGETLKARRGDLLLPSDFNSAENFVLLAISEAKTRFSSARHQTAKVDIPDLVRVIVLAFRDLDPECFLWPYSGSTLRLRFKSLLQALHLPLNTLSGIRPLDMGSLRAGGATWILSVTEDSELVRRRGRWLTSRTMEIYLQETSAIRYILCLSQDQRQWVLQIAHAFIPTLFHAEQLAAAQIPLSSWFILFRKL